MQQEIPVISTNIGGLPEVIGNDGECGFLTEKNDVEKFANNIVELYTNKLLYKKVVRNAKSRFLDKFTPEKMAIKYMDEIILLKNKESE